MKWKIDYIKKDAIVSVKISGQATWEGNRKMTEELIAEGRKNNTRNFLVDNRNLEHGLSVLQVDDLPRMLKEVGISPEYKIAVVYNPSKPYMSESMSFFRNSSVLESLHINLFTNSQDAIAWLKQPSALPQKSKY